MEETSKFYRCARQIQMYILELAGLVAVKNQAHYSMKTILTSIYVNFTFNAISSVYIWAFIRDCLSTKFNPYLVSEMFSFVGFHFRFMFMFSRKKKLNQMLKYAENLWKDVKNEEKVFVRLFVRKVTRLSTLYTCIVVTTITMDVVSNQLPQFIAKKANFTFHRNLPYPFFVDVQDSPNYEILLGIQVICMHTMTQVSVCVDTTIAFLIMIACGHFRLIQIRLSAIARDINEKEASQRQEMIGNDVVCRSNINCYYNSEKTDLKIKERLRNCIHYHRDVLEFCNDIAKLSSEFFMVELISTTYNLSFIMVLLAGNNVPFAEKLTFSMVLSILMLQLFICHYPPEVLLQESLGVADAAYMVPPFREDNLRMDKLIITLIMRSQVPFQLLAGGQIKLSLYSFGNMVKGAVSFFTVLRSFNE